MKALGPLCLAAVLSSAAGAARADTFLAKKDRYLRAKQRGIVAAAARKHAKLDWQRALRKRIGKQPPKLINIYNGHTEEIIAVRADKRAPIDLPASLINRFLRCHFTNQPTEIDKKTFDTMVAAARHFRSDRIIVISGYRSWKYNLSLIKKGREVSRRSQHVQGKAIDFALPNVPVKRLHAWCVRQKLGGVGLYPHSQFVHIDTGRVRYWSGK